MTRNPHAGALRHYKPQRITDKRDKADRDALDEQAADYLTWPGKMWAAD